MGESPDDLLSAVKLVVFALQGETPFPRTPLEAFAQPSKWMDLFSFIQPYALREIEEKRKRDK